MAARLMHECIRLRHAATTATVFNAPAQPPVVLALPVVATPRATTDALVGPQPLPAASR
jgi:hypothetical protein